MDPQALPAKCSASCSVKGGTPECCIVTLLRGSSDCTILSDFPSFLTTQNHRDRYEEFEGSNTPASIFCCMSRQTSLYIPGGIGMFRCTQGVCGTTGMSTGGKKSSLKCPLSVSFQAKAS